MFGKKKKEKACTNLLESITSSEQTFSLYFSRIKDSIMQNEGNMLQVYQEISFVISQDYGVKDHDVCNRVSVVLVTLVRNHANNYNDLDFKYHG